MRSVLARSGHHEELLLARREVPAAEASDLHKPVRLRVRPPAPRCPPRCSPRGPPQLVGARLAVGCIQDREGEPPSYDSMFTLDAKIQKIRGALKKIELQSDSIASSKGSQVKDSEVHEQGHGTTGHGAATSESPAKRVCAPPARALPLRSPEPRAVPRCAWRAPRCSWTSPPGPSCRRCLGDQEGIRSRGFLLNRSLHQLLAYVVTCLCLFVCLFVCLLVCLFVCLLAGRLAGWLAGWLAPSPACVLCASRCLMRCLNHCNSSIRQSIRT